MAEDRMAAGERRSASADPQHGLTQSGSHEVAASTRHLMNALLDVVLVALAFESAVLLRYLDGAALPQQLLMALPFAVLAGGIYALVAFATGFHRPLWRYASLGEGLALVRTEGLMLLIVGGLLFASSRGWLGTWVAQHIFTLSLSGFIMGSVIAFFYLGLAKLAPRLFASREVLPGARGSRMLIVGAGEAAAMLAAHLAGGRGQAYHLVGFLDDDQEKWGRHLHGRVIQGPITRVAEVVERERVDLIAIAIPSASSERISEILGLCQQTHARLKIVPGLDQMVGDEPYAIDLRDVNLADLLGRDVVPLRLSSTVDMLRGKTVLVTGAAGSIGSELCRQLISYQPARVLALDNNETGLFDLVASLRKSPYTSLLRACVGDITDATAMGALFAEHHPHIVYHAAAYKHVPLLEEHPYQATRVNVLGTHLLCRLAREHRVERFVFISTDKAADPVNVLGASKRLGELIVDAMARESDSAATSFRAVRFGNVIGSRGSVIPTFSQQIEAGGPVTVTDEATTRYFMTIPEACGLVIVTSSLEDAQGLFLLDMGEPVHIAEVAMKMIRMRGLRVGSDIQVIYTGLRPGEKMHEVLAAPDEGLVPTQHAKISRLEQKGDLPTYAEITRWMQSLESAMAVEDGETLKLRLLQHTQGPVAAH